MKAIPRADRPREKLATYGPAKLSNSELLAILLGSGTKGEHVVAMAERLLRTIGSDRIIDMDVATLTTFAGLGPARACEIVACFELGKRLLKEKKAQMHLSPHDVWVALRDIRERKKEHVIVLYLDSRNQEIERSLISIGTVNHSLVHPREVFEPAVEHTAAHILLAHNHPSGDPSPSEEDILLTSRIMQAGELMGIPLIDHVIVTKTGYRSMKEDGFL